jgi:hypothetical protein
MKMKSINKICSVEAICLGTGYFKDEVRCIKTKSKIIFPPYGKNPKWENYSDLYISVDDILIPKNLIENTYLQCLASPLKSEYISEEEFLKEITQFVKNNS